MRFASPPNYLLTEKVTERHYMIDYEGLILKSIINSAKKRFDYASFESVFSAFDDNGKQAESILLSILEGFMDGDTQDRIAENLHGHMFPLGVDFENGYIENLLVLMQTELAREVSAAKLANTMIAQGKDPMAILLAVRKFLA